MDQRERSPTWEPSADLATLRARANLVDRTRAFFRQRGLLEIDPPIIQGGANLDRGVDAVALDVAGERRWLITSPEHPLKRLIAAGIGEIWSLCPCIRAGELGTRHGPEFRMLEWYRLDCDDRTLAAECLELLVDLTGLAPDHDVLGYRQAFLEHAGVDPFTASGAALQAAVPPSAHDARPIDRDETLDLLLATVVQPALASDRWTVITDWPASQAAQARLRRDERGELVACRFEIYRGDLELANGYHECRDAGEISDRFERERTTGKRDGAATVDGRYVAALRSGLPDCAGVAVGFDRLVMLALGHERIASVQAFAWDRA